MKYISLFFTAVALSASEPHHIHTFLWGNYQQFKGAYEVALQSLAPLRHVIPTVAVYQSYVSALSDTQQYAYITTLADELDAKMDTDMTTQLLLAQAFERCGKQQKADTRYKTLVQRWGDDAECVYHAAQAYIRAQQAREALRIIERFLKEVTDYHARHVFYFLKAQAYEQLKQYDAAVASIEMALQKEPRFGHAWLLWGVLHEQCGRLKLAAQGYQKFIEYTGSSSALVEKVAALTTLAKTNSQTVLDQARRALQQGNYQQAVELGKKALQQSDDIMVYALMIEGLKALQREAEIRTLFEQALVQSPREDLLALMHAYFLCTAEKEALLQVLDTIFKHHEIAVVALYTLDCALRLENLKHAFWYAQQALKMGVPRDIHEKLLYELGSLAFKQKHHEIIRYVIEQALPSCSYPPLCNMVAYFYATDGKDVRKAEVFLAKALQAYPNNPHYLDTQACILMKKGDSTQARVLLKKLQKQLPDDPYIKQHLQELERL